jgi:hypothetical protein
VRRAGPVGAALSLGLGAGLATAWAWADHPGGLRAPGWSPLTAALVFGGLALLVGAIVVILVTVFTRRDSSE